MPNIQIGSAVQAPTMFLCPQCRSLNALDAEQQARYGLLPAVVFACGTCGVDVAFHKGGEQWEIRG